MKPLHELADCLLSYLTAGIAFFISLPLMKIGGAILLIARLISDVPPAYRILYIKARKFMGING